MKKIKKTLRNIRPGFKNSKFGILNSKLNSEKGFTLVELIIVIAIIAVLAVAAFMMLTKWLGKSRDSRRLSDLGTIARGLSVGYSDTDDGINMYPDIMHQDDKIGLMSGDEVLGYQGRVDMEVIKGASMQKVPLDPSDQNEYTYLVTQNRQKFQVLGMLEDGKEVSWLNDAFALEYKNRVPATEGFELGVLLHKDTNLPIQYANVSFTGIDLMSGIEREGYKAIVSEEVVRVGTGMAESPIVNEETIVIISDSEDSSSQTYSCKGSLVIANAIISNNTGLSADVDYQNTNAAEDCYYECKNGFGGDNCGTELTGWRLLDSNCDVEDIVVGNQIWAGCNSTIGNGMEYGQLYSDIGTDNYNGTVSCENYNGGSGTCEKGSSLMVSNSKANAWFSGQNTNGDSEVDGIWGKFYTWADSSTACGGGRHVPSDSEWEYLEETYAGTNCRPVSHIGWTCSVGWMNNNQTGNMVKSMKMPLSGGGSGGSFSARGRNTHFWTSTESSSTSAITRDLSYSNIGIGRWNPSKTNTYLVRCIKDAPIESSVIDDYVAYFPLNGTANDETGNHNGTIHGGVTYVADSNMGLVASFDGNGDYISTDNILGASTSFSISVWVNPGTPSLSDKAGEQHIVSIGDNGSSPRTMFSIRDNDSDNTDVLFGVYARGSSEVRDYSSETYAINNWYHVVFTIDGANGYIKVNNSENIPVENNNGTTQLVNDILLIGAAVDGSSYLSGKVSKVRVYNRALTSAEVTEIYNAEK